MSPLFENAPVLLLLMLFVIAFLQSGIDKVIDWRGNLTWLKSHFGSTIFADFVPVLLAILTVLELVASLISLIGLIQVFVSQDFFFAQYAAVLNCVVLLMLFLGQRIAKDYAGAQTIVVYFIPALFLLYLLQ